MAKIFPTLSVAIEGFILHKMASGLSHNTIRNYKNQLKRFKDWTDDAHIDKVSSKKIDEFFDYLQNGYRVSNVCKTTPIKPRRLSPKTIKNAWATLSVFWKWASKEFEIKNPFRVPQPKVHTKPIHPLSLEDIEKLLKVCEFALERKPNNRASYQARRPTRKRDKALILTLLDTGVRVSELCGIDVGDLDLESGRILVTGKGNKDRFVFLGKMCRKAIWAYIAERFPGEKPEPKEPLFVDQWGLRRLTRNSVLHLLYRLGKIAGVKKVHPHRFRHTFAIEFLRNGGDVFTLQQLLGHSSLDTVKKYLMITNMDLERMHRKASPADNWRLR